jgi:hypothetical protein
MSGASISPDIGRAGGRRNVFSEDRKRGRL